MVRQINYSWQIKRIIILYWKLLKQEYFSIIEIWTIKHIGYEFESSTKIGNLSILFKNNESWWNKDSIIYCPSRQNRFSITDIPPHFLWWMCYQLQHAQTGNQIHAQLCKDFT